MRKVRKKTIFDKINLDKFKIKKSDKETNSKKNKQTIKKKNTTSKKKNTREKEKKAKRSIWKKILTTILIIGIVGIIALAVFLGYIVITAPKFEHSAFNVQDQTVIYDINGEVITTLGTEKRESVSYDELPQVLIDAIIATEDSRYFQHNGVDLLRFIKATAYQLLGKSEAGGASTITMQAVKNNLTKKDSIETSKIDKIIRKFQDVYLAVFKVEKEYSKEVILEFYVNDNYLGGSAYGVEEASKYYFGKSVSELTLPEAALIAGLFQLPGANNPYKNLEGATARRNLVLKYMTDHGYITKQEAELAKKVTIESLLVGNEQENSYQGYVDTVVAEVEELTGSNPYVVPMKIYTTMERSIQDGIDSILSNDAWYWKDDVVQSGIAIVNVETGAIAAVGNGRNKTGVRQFRYATQALKQPGSTAKPIFDYAPGIEYNNFSSYTLFNDEPWQYTDGPSVNNWDGGFHGLVTTRYALQYSRNIPALKAFQQVGAKNSQKFAYSLGLDVSYSTSSENYRIVNETTGVDNTINEAYSIGGSAEGFSPLTMASAYAAFASGGYYTKPYTVTKIEFRNTGEVQEYKATKTRVMKDSTAYIMNNILESAVQVGFNGGASVSGSHVAAKTGTSNYRDEDMEKYNLPSNAVNDLWTVAYTSQYSIAVWYGYDELTETTYNTSNGGYKEGLVSAVMKYIPKDTKGWTMPSSVVASQVEKDTWPAKLPSENTPEDMILTEYFVRGTQPTEVSTRYADLNNVKNLKTDKNGNTVTLTWNYDLPEVLTESYLKKYFSQSVFGKETDKYIKAREDYNENVLGEIGFGIYEEQTDGTLNLIAYTNEMTYEYTGYGEKTLVVKAEHKNYKTNASSGTSVKLSLGTQPTGKLTATLAGKTPVSTKIKTYKEDGIKTINYITSNEGTISVLNSAKITYQINVNGTIKEETDKQKFEDYVNTLPAGTYKITYVINYLNEELTKNRTLTLT